MTMTKTILAAMVAALAAAPVAVVQAQAPYQVQAPATHVYTQAELDQMLAPIALYPDSLLSQVLMAATYPIEVVEAARWSRANPGLQGDAAVRAVQGEDWDPSVKSLCAFPQILQRMDENLEWTRALGDAFLAQESQVMDQVQQLRQRAAANGNLRSDEQIRVLHEGPVIVVRPARPEYVYVPYYDPLEVYGTWWWPDYRPVYWAPWPGYVRPRPSYAFWWGRPTGISLNFFFGDFDWGRRHVRVAHNSYYYRQPVYFSRAYSGDRTRWQHDPQHRRSVDYRSNEVRQRFAGAQFERRADRQPAQFQAQPGARTQLQAQPQAQRQTPSDRRDDRRTQRQAAPAVTPAQPAAQPRADRRDDRRAERQAAPVVTPAQPRPEQRDDRRAERQAAMEAQRQARQQAQEGQRQAQQQQARQQAQAAQRQAQDAQRQAQQQAQHQARQQAQAAQRQAQDAQRQARQEQRAATPAAQAPQQARTDRQERREQRRNRREERGEKAG